MKITIETDGLQVTMVVTEPNGEWQQMKYDFHHDIAQWRLLSDVAEALAIESVQIKTPNEER